MDVCSPFFFNDPGESGQIYQNNLVKPTFAFPRFALGSRREFIHEVDPKSI